MGFVVDFSLGGDFSSLKLFVSLAHLLRKVLVVWISTEKEDIEDDSSQFDLILVRFSATTFS